MLTGEIVKRIRLKKNIPSQVIYQDLIAKSTYNKFENGLIDTSTETFMEILSRLGIHLFEFARYYVVELLDLGDRQKVLEGSAKAIVDEDYQLFAEMGKLSLDLYKRSGDLVDYHNYLQLRVYEDYTKNGAVIEAQPELMELFEYLLSRETLFRYDITDFSNILPFLTWQQVAPHVSMLMKRAEISPLPVSTALESVTKASVYYNLIDIAIREKRPKVFVDLVTQLTKIEVSQEDTIPYFSRVMFTACKDYLLSQEKNQLLTVERLLADLQLVGLNGVNKKLSETYFKFREAFVH